MDVVRQIEGVPDRLRGAVVAIGNFDGVHRGHRKVIGAAQALANDIAAPAGVVSFHPHPRRYFAPGAPFFRLTPLPLKLRILEALGLDVVFVVGFDAGIAAMTAREFVSSILVDGFGVRHVVAGWDFRFGAKRAGDAALLERLGAEFGFGVTIVERQANADGAIYSSTLVRNLLAEGQVGEAAKILGYRWRLTETVIGGEGRGRGLGFPTINMRLEPEIRFAHGIYAVRVIARGEVHGGAAYHGTRPTFGGSEPFLETFLFDFDGDLYGEEVEIEFVDYLREDRAFDGEEALRRQVERDCEAAQAALARLDGDTETALTLSDSAQV